MIYKAHRIRPWNLLIKILVIGAFAGAATYQLFIKRDFYALWTEFSASLSPGKLWALALVVALMPLNWILEAGKWKILMRPALQIPFMISLKAVLSGLSVSLFTPNRIGEYGGRILFVPPAYNWRAVLASIVGSISQNIVHIGAGLAAVLIFVRSEHLLPGYYNGGLLIILGLILFGMLIGYANISALSGWLLRVPHPRWLNRPWRAFHHLKKTGQQELSIALLIAFVRYLIFSSQFVLLLWFFEVDVPVFWMYGGVAVMFLMQTSVPLPPFADVFARSELALILWSGFTINELAVVTASFSLWIINLLIPAFFGLIAMSTVNVLESLGYDKKNKTAPGSFAPDPVVGVSRFTGDDE